MVSTQDFAHEVWLSLENIRERLAVLETELRHTRRDLLRVETALTTHTSNHRCQKDHHDGRDDNGNGGVSITISRKLLGLIGGVVAVMVGAGKALGWW